MSRAYEDYPYQKSDITSPEREQGINITKYKSVISALQSYHSIIPWIFLFALTAAELAVGYWISIISIKVNTAAHHLHSAGTMAHDNGLFPHLYSLEGRNHPSHAGSYNHYIISHLCCLPVYCPLALVHVRLTPWAG